MSIQGEPGQTGEDRGGLDPASPSVPALCKAFRNWKKACKFRVQRKPYVLAPWDELPYFDGPFIGQFVHPGNGAFATVIQQDAMRVAIHFMVQISASPQATQLWYVCPFTSVPQGMISPFGFPLNDFNLPSISFYQGRDGSIVQGPWSFVNNIPGAAITFITLRMRDWPKQP